MWEPIAQQSAKALCYYLGLLLLTRLSGKRLAGRMTTFDLIVLITLGVVLQMSLLTPGFLNSMIFIGVVFLAHKSLSHLCARSRRLRHLVRGAPRALVRDGVVLPRALADEGLSREELLAGLRKLGFSSESEVRLAVLEETGEISAVGGEEGEGDERVRSLPSASLQ